LGYIFVADIIGIYSITCSGSKATEFGEITQNIRANTLFKVKVADSGTNPYTTSY